MTPPEDSDAHVAHPRAVRSFVTRAGRMTVGQARALSELGLGDTGRFTGLRQGGDKIISHETQYTLFQLNEYIEVHFLADIG